MAERVILTAHTADGQYALVHKRQRLVILRDGQAVDERTWDDEEIEHATEAFYSLIRNIGR